MLVSDSCLAAIEIPPSRPEVDTAVRAAGSLNFGYIDSAAYTGEIVYTEVKSLDNWRWDSSGHAIGSGSFKSITIPAIVDTTYSFLLLPDSVVSDYYGQISGARYGDEEGGYIFPCSASVPDFAFGLDESNTVITIPGDYVKYSVTNLNETTCFGGIQKAPAEGSVFGNVALKAAFVVFDPENYKLGWASKPLS